MPPPRLRVPIAGRMRSTFVCPSCTVTRSIATARSASLIPAATHFRCSPLRAATKLASKTSTCIDARRHASTATAAAVNVQSTGQISPVDAADAIPERFRELYAALNGLKAGNAAEHIDLSRAQFAQRSLESENPVLRVAVLSIGENATTALKLVRSLLADPLSPKADWEEYLEASADPARGLLIKYGDETELSMPSSLIPTISIPSRLLRSQNIEILVSSLNGQSLSNASLIAGDLLLPAVPIQSTVSNQQGTIRFPVHKTLVCGSGINDVLLYSNIINHADISKYTTSIQATFHAHARGEQASTTASGVSLVDTDRALAGLEKFRESAKNAPEYQRDWSDSNVQPLVEWLSDPRPEGGLRAAIKDQVRSLIEDAERSVQQAQTKAVQTAQALTVPESVRAELHAAVDSWAERNHTELREELAKGFASSQWRNLAWWKLFWHADDVGMITEKVLRERWLKKAESETIWMGGRLKQAGLLTEDPSVVREKTEEFVEPTTQETAKEGEVVEEKPNERSKEQTRPVTLWPSSLAKARTDLINTSIPPLQALTQDLVFFSISTTTLTSALSALYYFWDPATTVYEAGIIGTIGLYISLRRQQKRWDAARVNWERDVHEQGRQELKGTEEFLREMIVKEGRKQPVLEHVHDARATIEKVRLALEKFD